MKDSYRISEESKAVIKMDLGHLFTEVEKAEIKQMANELEDLIQKKELEQNKENRR